MRSKKSAAWRGRHGEYTSLFGDAPDWTNIPANVLDSDGLLKSILLNALSVLTDAEIRALSINPASSPTLQVRNVQSIYELNVICIASCESRIITCNVRSAWFADGLRS